MSRYTPAPVGAVEDNDPIPLRIASPRYADLGTSLITVTLSLAGADFSTR
jgi:hypothetical protein